MIDGQDLYVNDAFGVAHRNDASVVGPPRHLPSAAGRLFIEEVNQLSVLLKNPKAPFVAILGGLKISDKLRVVEALLDRVDSLLVGGAMAFTFLKAQGHDVGSSLVEESMVETCANLLKGDVPIYLPSDFVALEENGTIGTVDDSAVENFSGSIKQGWMGVDIGPETAAIFSEIILEAGTVFWNGPMGAFEDPRFAAGTSVVADALAGSEAFSVVGGGDSAAAVAQLGAADNIDHISTGGGASLKYIETGDLVALKALRESKKKIEV